MCLFPCRALFYLTRFPLSPRGSASDAHLFIFARDVCVQDVKPQNLLLLVPGGTAEPLPSIGGGAAGGAAAAAAAPLTPATASALILSGRIVLGDFGSALKLQHTQGDPTNAGTVPYRAPELLAYSGYKESIDIWAFGVTLLELATGHVVGSSVCAQRALADTFRADPANAPWTIERSLSGIYHDKFAAPTAAEKEAAWMARCAGELAVWKGLGEGLKDIIRGCVSSFFCARGSSWLSYFTLTHTRID